MKKQAKKSKTKSKKIEDQSKEIKALKKDKVETGAPYPDETEEEEDGGTK
jgi:hypothetical protein